MKRYNPRDIEPRWQAKWETDKTYVADLSSPKPKYVGFGMFNYPSGAGIHVGHVRNYTIPDVVTRVKRQQGYETYQPVGWDSFGLPAENFAIKTGVSPQESTTTAIEKYREQYRAMGWAVDWTREINTTDPAYYKWTQWIFIKLFENGLAYQKQSAQWWCDKCKTVLADEQVINGKCWRHDSADDSFVTKKNLKQWFFKITEYADELLQATDDLDWTQSVKASQKSWIGRSAGADIIFKIEGIDDTISVFTTRADTIFSAAFIVLAPEHSLTKKITTNDNQKTVEAYTKTALSKTDVQRQADEKEKSGVFTGAYAINPANNERIPIWVADFVLGGYGTGAVFGDIHDERDFEFIKKYGIKAKATVVPEDETEAQKVKGKEYCFTGEGMLIDSGEFTGLRSEAAREKIIAWLAEKKAGRETVNYKMRDWLISRQRYWGAPIPIIHCPKDGAVAVPEGQLPVLLPEVENYQPTGGNTSVLAGVDSWVNTSCPKCGEPAKRETDTMDGYVCSSWYFLRYLSPKDDKQAWDKKMTAKWMPVDFYNGGDHATAHLLYARFFTRFFHKLGLVSGPEPFKKMVYNGKVRASDGSAFSKSKGNGVDPLEIIENGYGADALRLYEMFAAPVELNVLWDEQGVPGMHRFLSRVWTLCQQFLDEGQTSKESTEHKILQLTHRTIKKVSEDVLAERFNTALAALMEMTNELYKIKAEKGFAEDWKTALEDLLKLLAPFAPHITEELWHQLGHDTSIHTGNWPVHDEKYLLSDKVTIVVQVNGKVRANLELAAVSSEEQVAAAAKADENVQKYLKNKNLHKTIYVPGRLINLVVS